MNEEPKSIWKTSRKGPHLFLIWLVLMIATIVAFSIGILIIGNPFAKSSELVGVVLIDGVVSASVLLGLWLFIPRLFRWRNFKRFLFGLACLATLIGLFYAEENWRGKRAWDNYRRELEARGEQLDPKTFIPKPVPDEQNFAATPFVRSWFDRENYPNNPKRWSVNDNYALASMNVTSAKADKDKGNRHFMDLVAWQMAFDALQHGKLDPNQKFESGQLDLESRAKAVPSILEGLRTNGAAFAELRAASHRPYSRYPLVYDLENPWGILLPHLSSVRNVCKRLQLKACAELAAGQSEQALEDVNLILYMADSVKEEPTPISYLVRIACLDLGIQPIWEGMAEHAWSDAQLQQLQTRLQQYDFVVDLKLSLDSERAIGVLTVDLVRKKGMGFLVDMGGGSPTSSSQLAKLISLIVPSGWNYQEQLNYCRLFQIQLGGTFDPIKKTVSPSRVQANDQAFEQALFRGAGAKRTFSIIVHHRTIAGTLLPVLGGIARRAATAQTAADQAALACALERYRLANGQFPDALEALVPQFISQLPHDVLTGEPYKYRRTSGGQFVLYSVGWNEKDDGGVPGTTLFDEKQGDWVWRYPATQ